MLRFTRRVRITIHVTNEKFLEGMREVGLSRESVSD